MWAKSSENEAWEKRGRGRLAALGEAR